MKWLRRRIIASVATQAAETFAVVAIIAFALMQWRTDEGALGSLLGAVVVGQIVALARVGHAMRNNPLNYEFMSDFVERPFTYRVTRFRDEDEQHPVAEHLPGFAPVATIRDSEADPEPIFDIYHDPSRLVAASVSRASGALALVSSLADGRVLVTDARVLPPHERLVMNPAESDDVETIIAAHRRAITSRGDITELASSAHQVVLDSLTLEYESFVGLGALLSPFFDLEPRDRLSARLCARIKPDELRELPTRLGPDTTPTTGPAHPAASQWGFADIISPNGRATPVEPGTAAALEVTERIVDALVDTEADSASDSGALDSTALDSAAPDIAAPDIAVPNIVAPVITAPEIAPVVASVATIDVANPPAPVVALSLADHVAGEPSDSPAANDPVQPAVSPAPPAPAPPAPGAPVFAAVDAGAVELTDLGAAPAQISTPEIVQLEVAAVAAVAAATQQADAPPPVGPSQFTTVEPDHPEHFVSNAPITADVPVVVVSAAPAIPEVPAAHPAPAEVTPQPETGLLPMPAPVTVAPAEPVLAPLPASPVATPQPTIPAAQPLAVPENPIPTIEIPDMPAPTFRDLPAPPATLAEAIVSAPDTPAAVAPAPAPVPAAAAPAAAAPAAPPLALVAPVPAPAAPAPAPVSAAVAPAPAPAPVSAAAAPAAPLPPRPTAAPAPPATLAEAVVPAPDTPAALTEGVHIPEALQGSEQLHDPSPSLAAAIGFADESDRPRPRLSAALKAHPAAPSAPKKRGRRKTR